MVLTQALGSAEVADASDIVDFVPTKLVIVQPTPFCNINCSYCYLANRSSNKRLTLETVQALVRFLGEVRVEEEPLTVCWHAGEPLVVPPSFYEQAFQAFASSPVAIRQNIQTNATLITDEWCVLFRKWSVQVGVSIDGPQALHDAHRVDRAGLGTFDRTMRGVAKLREHGIPFSIIAVLTSSSLDKAEELWHFFRSTGACGVGFNVDEAEGIYKRSTLRTVEQIGKFRQFMSRIADLQKTDSRVDFREVRDMRSHLTAPPAADVARGDNRPGTILNVDCDGNVTTFSPELLGQKHIRYGTFSWGNVHVNSWREVASHPGFRLAWKDIRAGVELCRQTCQYFKVCGGGCPSNKLAEKGTFASTETRSCRFHVQAVADAMIEHLEREIERERPKTPPPLKGEHGKEINGSE